MFLLLEVLAGKINKESYVILTFRNAALTGIQEKTADSEKHAVYWSYKMSLQGSRTWAVSERDFSSYSDVFWGAVIF